MANPLVIEEEFQALLQEKGDEEKLSDHGFHIIMFEFRQADHAHTGQKREDGTPYVEHPKAVALILIRARIFEMHDIEFPVEAVCAALLHDAKEDVEGFFNWSDIRVGRDRPLCQANARQAE